VIVLSAKKRDHADIAKRTRVLTAVAHATGLRRVFDDRQTVALANLRDLGGIRSLAIDVHGHQRRSPGRDGALERLGTRREGVRVHVDQDRLETREHRRASRRHEGESRDDDFAAPRQIQRQQGKEQAERAIGCQGNVVGTRELAQALPEGGCGRALGQPVPFDAAVECFKLGTSQPRLNLLNTMELHAFNPFLPTLSVSEELNRPVPDSVHGVPERAVQTALSHPPRTGCC